MPPGTWARTVFKNTVRSPKHFVLSAFGIVIGIASFVFFLGLSIGVGNVLGEVFPVDQVEVRAPRASATVSGVGLDATRKITDETVEIVRNHKFVKDAVPRMNLAFPAAGVGRIEGFEMKFEVGGFCDGIDPSYVEDEEWGHLFRDWPEIEEGQELRDCGPAPDYSCEPKDTHFCDMRDKKCHHRVPVIVSHTLVELYNGQFASSHGLPVIELDKYMEKRGLAAMRFDILLGSTTIAGTDRLIEKEQRRMVEGLVIGVSDKAIQIGLTVPIQYIKRWNAEYASERAATEYSSIIVTLRDKSDIAPFSTWLQDELDLRIEDSMGERFATALFIVTTLFVLISFIIVAISAINIAHNFFMQISERRREIGVLRAVGATRADVRMIILGESALIGVIGGVIGVVVALGAAHAVDWMSAAWLPRFPFKPETYFDFQPWIIGGGVGFSILFCVLGGFLPARKAARMEPAQALAQQ